MKAVTRILLLGVVVAVWAGHAGAAGGGGAELPPAESAPKAAATTTSPSPTTTTAAANTTRKSRGSTTTVPPTASRTKLSTIRHRSGRRGTTTAVAVGAPSATEAKTMTTTTTTTTTTATTTTTTSTAPPPTASSSPRYSIYDMRHYMDEESLARETSLSSPPASSAWKPFVVELTTPSVPYFDRMHSDVVAGIEHNIDQVLSSQKRKEVSFSEREEEDNTVEPSHYFSSKPSDVRLDFSNRVEFIYNSTKGPTSVRRDLVVMNGTHLDLEINRTTVYPIEEFSTVSYFEQTTLQEETHQTLRSDNKEIVTLPITTTDIPEIHQTLHSDNKEIVILPITTTDIPETHQTLRSNNKKRITLPMTTTDNPETHQTLRSSNKEFVTLPVTTTDIPESHQTLHSDNKEIFTRPITTTDIPETHPTLRSDDKEVVTHPVVTTDIPGTTDAATENLRSHVVNSFSADSVQNEITVSPDESKSTKNNFMFTEVNRLATTTEMPDTVPTTEVSFSFKETVSQKPTTASAVQSATEFTESDDSIAFAATTVYDITSTTSRRPPWVPHQPEATTTDLPEMQSVPPSRSSRGRMMSLSASGANSVHTTDAEGSGSVVEVLTTESPEENTVYPLRRSSSPSTTSSSTRRKIYTFKNLHATRTTTVPSASLPSTSAKSTEDNIITVERSPPVNVVSNLTNSSAGNNERNDISNIYSFPPVTSRGTLKYTSKAVNSSVSSPPAAAVSAPTSVRGRGQRLRRPQNTSSTPIMDDERETSYIRVQTLDRPRNSSSSSGNEVNRSTSRTRFTPLGPTRIRTIAEDDRNSSEWPNSSNKIYVFPSTAFPSPYNSMGNMGLSQKDVRQNKTSLAGTVFSNTSDKKFTTENSSSYGEVTTESTTQLPDVTFFPVSGLGIQDFSSTHPSSTSSSTPSSTITSTSSPAISATSIRTMLFPTHIHSSTTPKYVAPLVITWPSTTRGPSVVTVSPTLKVTATTEPVETVDSVVTFATTTERILRETNASAIPSVDAPRATVPLESTSHEGNVPSGAGARNGSLVTIHSNGSKRVPDEDLRHVVGGLVEEESPQHGEGNQLPDIGQPSRDWNHRGPNRPEGAHEDVLPPADDLDYGGGAIGGNDLDVVASNTTAAESPSGTVKKDTPTITTTTPIPNTTTSESTETTNLPGGKVTAYLLLLTDASWYEVCQISDTFRTAVATLLSEATNKLVQPKQVILLNVSPALCSDVMLKTDESEKQLVPIEFYFTDNNNMFDLQMCQQFRDAWKNHRFEYPYPVRSVELVLTEHFVPNTTAIVSEESNAGTVAAVVISCVGIVSLILLAVLVFVLMRKRQKRFNYGQRCTPVSLDAYSLDSVSVCNSVRRKAARASKRSYSNAAFDDPNAPSHPINFAGLANFTSDVAALEEEFGMIPQLSPKVDEVPQGAELKNRYANVIPLPETRVTLSPIEGDPLSEYINANYVRGPKGVEKFYIACQAPLQATVTDFWRMVWENQSKVILMLTDLVEDGKEKCADYLPPSEVTDCHRLFGDFQITLKNREVKDKYIISLLQIKNLETNLWREVSHLWYLGWPAQGVPEEATSLIAFLIEARSHTRANTGPIVVHCSPGTGRTGTVLACDLCIREFEQTRLVDIPRCVFRLRRDRAGAVQTKEQYVFIYQVLNIYATKLTGGALESF